MVDANRLKKELFTQILDRIEFMPGSSEIFKLIHEKGIVTALISGGFKHQADRAILKLGIKHSFVACEYFWDKNGFLKTWNLLPADYLGKLGFMQMLIKEYGISHLECAFVGDGKNDCALAKSVGRSIAFNAAKELQKISTHSILQASGQEDLRAVLPFIL